MTDELGWDWGTLETRTVLPGGQVQTADAVQRRELGHVQLLKMEHSSSAMPYAVGRGFA